jgi:hypothetical protein
MSEEVEAQVEETSPQEEVETPTETEEVAHEVPEEPDPETDNAARSKLGRRVAGLEEQLAQQTEVLRQLLAQNQPPEPEPGDDDYFITKENFDRMMERREAAKTKAQKEYEQGYRAILGELKKENPENHEAVVKIMLDKYNVKRSGNPAVDAQLNYAKAQVDFIKNGAKVNLRQDSADGAGVSAGTRTAPQKPKMPKLDPEAEAFLKDIGKDAEWAAKALQGK